MRIALPLTFLRRNSRRAKRDKAQARSGRPAEESCSVRPARSTCRFFGQRTHLVGNSTMNWHLSTVSGQSDEYRDDRHRLCRPFSGACFAEFGFKTCVQEPRPRRVIEIRRDPYLRAGARRSGRTQCARGAAVLYHRLGGDGACCRRHLHCGRHRPGAVKARPICNISSPPGTRSPRR